MRKCDLCSFLKETDRKDSHREASNSLFATLGLQGPGPQAPSFRLPVPNQGQSTTKPVTWDPPGLQQEGAGGFWRTQGVTLLKAEAMVCTAYVIRSQGLQQVRISSWGSRQRDKATMDKDTEAHCSKPTSPARALLYSRSSGQSRRPWTPTTVSSRKAHQEGPPATPQQAAALQLSRGTQHRMKGHRTLGQTQPSRKKTKTTDISAQLHTTHWVSFSAENRTVPWKAPAAPGSHRKLAPPNQFPRLPLKTKIGLKRNGKVSRTLMQG